MYKCIRYTVVGYVLLGALMGCRGDGQQQASEQLKLTAESGANADVESKALTGKLSWDSLPVEPHQMLLTRHPQWRLMSIYRLRHRPSSGFVSSHKSRRESYYSSDGDDYAAVFESDFMPGIDLVRGQHLVGILVHDMKTGASRQLFERPVIVRSLYFPSVSPDTVDKKPLIRSYYLATVYDEDTNRDTVLNRTDLRRAYLFDLNGTRKTALLPEGYSAVRSQYDPDNDVMFLFARYDVNRNGSIDILEPVHCFRVSLRQPGMGVRVY